jgi:hypothetical protein
MAIEWDSLLVEMAFLAAMIYSAIFVEGWVQKRKIYKDEKMARAQIIGFVTNDLKNKLRFIEESIKYHDFKPFFTDMWDSVILGGKQTLLPFTLFENLQHTYSWMKYYNNELEQWKKRDDEKDILEILHEVKKSIDNSITRLSGQ